MVLRNFLTPLTNTSATKKSLINMLQLPSHFVPNFTMVFTYYFLYSNLWFTGI